MLMVACLLSPTVAQVSWFLKTTEAKLETNDSIELVCQVTGTCCSSLRSWKDGTGKALITNGVTTLPNKYKETINASSLQFSLLIYNLTVSDLNINYQCQYGFDSSQQYLNMSESIFRYVTQKTEISLLKWNYTGNQLSVAVNLTRVFPEPNCTASFKDNSIFYVPSATTYDKGLFKYTELSMINVGYICPGTLTITCMVGSYPFEVFSGNPCPATTTVHQTTAQLHTVVTTFNSTVAKPTNTDMSSTTTLGLGGIIGVAIGASALLLLIIVLCICFQKRRGKKKSSQSQKSFEIHASSLKPTSVVDIHASSPTPKSVDDYRSFCDNGNNIKNDKTVSCVSDGNNIVTTDHL